MIPHTQGNASINSCAEDSSPPVLCHEDISQGNTSIQAEENDTQNGGASESSPLLGASGGERGEGNRVTHPLGDNEQPTETGEESLCSLTRKLAPITALMMIHGCASAIHIPFISQYVYGRYATDFHVNVSLSGGRGAEGGDSQCVANGTGDLSEGEKEAQEASAQLLLHMALLTGLPGVVAILALGSYANRLGPRCILMAMLLGRLGRESLVWIVVWWRLDINLLLLAYTLDGLTGSYASFLLAIYVYTAMVCPGRRHRTVALTMVYSSHGVALAGCSLGAGWLTQKAGFRVVFAIPVIVYLIGIFIVLACMRSFERQHSQPLPPPWTAARKLVTFYVDAVPGRSRGLFWLGTLAYGLMVMESFNNAATLYQMAPPFCWDAFQVGLYGMVRDLSVSVVSLGLVRLLQLCMRDEAIAVLGVLTATARNLITGLSTTSLMLYLAGGVGFACGIIFPTIRSLLSCMLEPEELGALFACMSVVETAACMTAKALSSKLYQATVRSFRGAVFFNLAGYDLVALVALVVFFCRVNVYRRLRENQTNSVEP